MLKWLFGRKSADPSEALYVTLSHAARREHFYTTLGVPDSIDGRFDLLVLHMFLTLDRLRDFGAEADALRQALTDRFFAEMDATLREIGVGDLSVGKKVRKMAEAFFGRVTAYTAAMKTGEATLTEALARNVYVESDASHAADLAAWTFRARAHLQQLTLADFANGKVSFE